MTSCEFSLFVSTGLYIRDTLSSQCFFRPRVQCPVYKRVEFFFFFFCVSFVSLYIFRRGSLLDVLLGLLLLLLFMIMPIREGRGEGKSIFSFSRIFSAGWYVRLICFSAFIVKLVLSTRPLTSTPERYWPLHLKKLDHASRRDSSGMASDVTQHWINKVLIKGGFLLMILLWDFYAVPPIIVLLEKSLG